MGSDLIRAFMPPPTHLSTIVAGSRDVRNYDVVRDALDKCPWEIVEVISGTARGADELGERWAHENRIPARLFPAEWGKYGKGAGPMRNEEMANFARVSPGGGGLVLIWFGDSAGSADMLRRAQRAKLHIHEVRLTRVPMPPGVPGGLFR